MSPSITQPGEAALQSELVRYSLPPVRRDPGLWLAWVNSICLAFLVVGIIGLRRPTAVERVLPPLKPREISVLELPAPPPLAPAEVVAAERIEVAPDLPALPASVPVLLEQPEVVFSVPGVGDVLVSQSPAALPPWDALEMPVAEPRQAPVDLGSSLGTRYFPAPQWTTRLMQARMSGTVVLLITVDNSGAVTDIAVAQSTGFRALDEHTVNHVKRHFIFPIGRGVLTYELPVQWDNPLTRR